LEPLVGARVAVDAAVGFVENHKFAFGFSGLFVRVKLQCATFGVGAAHVKELLSMLRRAGKQSNVVRKRKSADGHVSLALVARRKREAVALRHVGELAEEVVQYSDEKKRRSARSLAYAAVDPLGGRPRTGDIVVLRTLQRVEQCRQQSTCHTALAESGDNARVPHGIESCSQVQADNYGVSGTVVFNGLDQRKERVVSVAIRAKSMLEIGE